MCHEFGILFAASYTRSYYPLICSFSDNNVYLLTSKERLFETADTAGSGRGDGAGVPASGGLADGVIFPAFRKQKQVLPIVMV